MKHPPRWVQLRATSLLLVACWLLTGCATPQVARLDTHWPAELPVRASLDSVPFYPQDDYQCGPAALATVATAAGVSVDPATLVPQVYLPGRQGSLQVEMLTTARRQGLLAYVIAPQIEALLREVAAGHPVVVLQNLALHAAPVWHYAVVVGYDRTGNVITLHSGHTKRMEMSLFTFERTWARASYWAMLALQPDQLPATAQPGDHVAAAAALEHVAPQAASRAYARALARWPGQRMAMLGLGNAAYGQKDLESAATAYEAATQAHPDFADAWNNLAQVRLELDQPGPARRAVMRAIALGGPHIAKYRALLQEIDKKFP